MRQNSKSYIRKMHPRCYGEKFVEFALGGGEDLNTFIPEGFFPSLSETYSDY